MTVPRNRPPGAADERTQLVGWLDLQRAVVHAKCAGLTEEQAHRRLLPTSPVVTPAGLVAHLRWVEHCWFEVLLLDRPVGGNPMFGDDPDGTFDPGGAGLAELLDAYARQCAVSDENVAGVPLDARGRHPHHGAGDLTLRWMLLHMVQEVARHAGQLDVLREQLDGARGS